MHTAIPSPARSKKDPRNKGRLIGQKRPRPWKNVSCDVGDALCFSAVTVETPVDRLAGAA
jgi:hypothetical protein